MHKLDLSGIKGVAWDFDGVIADTIPLHLEARKAAFQELGLTGFTDQEHQDAHHFGSSPTQVIGHLIRTHQPDAEQSFIDSVVERKNELYGEFVRERVTLIPGIEGLIKATHDLVNGNLVLTTTGYKSDVAPAMERLGMAIYFTAHEHITNEDVTKQKPDPEPYLLALSRLELEHGAEMLVIEDSKTGVESAKAAGGIVLALTTTTPSELLAAADVVCDVSEAVELLLR